MLILFTLSVPISRDFKLRTCPLWFKLSILHRKQIPLYIYKSSYYASFSQINLKKYIYISSLNFVDVAICLTLSSILEFYWKITNQIFNTLTVWHYVLYTLLHSFCLPVYQRSHKSSSNGKGAWFYLLKLPHSMDLILAFVYFYKQGWALALFCFQIVVAPSPPIKAVLVTEVCSKP